MLPGPSQKSMPQSRVFEFRIAIPGGKDVDSLRGRIVLAD
jgi:hypothetical protein